MASLTDLFNPTFLMFLGILVLVVALVVVYFESKLREQNHKIASMFSIVSTLAEDANGMKMGLNQLMNFNNVIGGSAPENFIQQPLENSKSLYQENTKLIEVSDDDNEDNESDDESASDDDDEIIADESDNESASEVDDNSSLGKYMDDMESEPDSLSDSELQEHVEQEKITVFKLKQDVVNEEESIDDLASELSDNDLGDIENVEEEATKEEPVLNISELKTISINLEEPTEKIDYKKMQLPKLRSIVVEKGLSTNSDASKLKKAELLKLLGIE